MYVTITYSSYLHASLGWVQACLRIMHGYIMYRILVLTVSTVPESKDMLCINADY